MTKRMQEPVRNSVMHAFSFAEPCGEMCMARVVVISITIDVML